MDIITTMGLLANNKGSLPTCVTARWPLQPPRTHQVPMPTRWKQGRSSRVQWHCWLHRTRRVMGLYLEIQRNPSTWRTHQTVQYEIQRILLQLPSPLGEWGGHMGTTNKSRQTRVSEPDPVTVAIYAQKEGLLDTPVLMETTRLKETSKEA